MIPNSPPDQYLRDQNTPAQPPADLERISTGRVDLGNSATDSANSAGKPRRKWRKSVLLTLLGLLLIWGPVLFVIPRIPPEYVAAWTILIPGSNVGTSIDLESTGQANTSIASQYSIAGIDPQVNYKAIALSLPVRKRAAVILDVPVEEIEKPKVKLTQQTSLMQLIFTSDDADGVTTLANTYYDAFMQQLETLRNEIQSIKESETRSQADGHRETVNNTTRQLDEFREENALASVKQHDSLLSELDGLNSLLHRTEIEKAATDAKLVSIKHSLDIDTETAGQMLKLQNDQLFQALIASYSQSHIAYLSENATLGRNHPKVIAARSEANRHLGNLQSRAERILGQAGQLDQLGILPGANEVNSNIIADYLQLEAEAQSLQKQVVEIRNSIDTQAGRLQKMTRLRTELESLEREQEVATTIYASVLARVDLENIDRFSVYPITQLLSPAEKPQSKETLKLIILLAAALAGTMLVLLAASTYWLWNKWHPATQKS